MPLTLVLISDTHGHHRAVKIPNGDVLVHAGDLTMDGDLDDVVDFNNFLGALPHRHKIVVAGNHDFCFERHRESAEAALTNAVYLEDSEVTIEGVRFYGSPWQPWFFDWAFNRRRGPDIQAKWELIPPGIDVLITHGPPAGHGDKLDSGERVGCADLLAAMDRVRPRLHVFGHIHEGVGVTSNGPTTFINASICDPAYRPSNPPTVYHLTQHGPTADNPGQ
jgi:Icc-related predicted phosphoesterase